MPIGSAQIRRLVRSCLILLWTPVVAPGETVTIYPVADTGIFELDPNYNMGRQRDVPAGSLGPMGGLKRSRMLLKFDVAGAVPAGSTIESASMAMTVTSTPPGKTNSTFGLHEILEDWGEGDKLGDIPGGRPATTGEATWNHRFFDSVAWGDGGGNAGDDFEDEPGATSAVVGNGQYLFPFNGTGLATIRRMLNQPAGNFGWMLISDAEDASKTARRWGTRENLTESRRPALTIEYTVPSEPPVPELLGLEIDGGNVTVRFIAEAGVNYSIEVNESLADGTWVVTGGVVARLETGEESVEVPFAGDGLQFLRLVAAWPTP